MWRILLLGLTGFVSAQEIDDDEVVVSDEPENKIPSPQDLLKMLNSMGLSEEEKNKLREDIMKSQGGHVESDSDTVEAYTSSAFFSQTVVLLLLLSVITSIFVFFGYKLYKSLSDRERKREEKKKMKQLKKKK
ncbi:uncharacterized protein LOC122511668 isoform X1 [Leptopilina heterotoma]|uniref:uncharacterized protein LOC122511668 isoform X1 n=1 Tax=Leptopilina heterotoma TaxID=63436 RepID=UPI001CA7F355|nr:uncharacterized protein LOC122511668 isoform X1 [Leptopilina heterotoma]